MYVGLLHRFFRHLALCYGGTSGRRVKEILNALRGDVRLYDELGLPEGRAPKITVGQRKSNCTAEYDAILQPLYPDYTNVAKDPGFVSSDNILLLCTCL